MSDTGLDCVLQLGVLLQAHRQVIAGSCPPFEQFGGRPGHQLHAIRLGQRQPYTFSLTFEPNEDMSQVYSVVQEYARAKGTAFGRRY